ncbi:MAG: L,D-transpeptidase family protein [Patescibacteria group bacterium]
MEKIKSLFSKLIGAQVHIWIVGALLVVQLSIFAVVFWAYRMTTAEYLLPVSPNSVKAEFAYGSRPGLMNADYFKEVKDTFVQEQASFIEADLSAMLVRVYKEGVMVKEVKILTKGREGSWWETPAGIYKIESKSKNHFSSFGKVYQPWSMAFQGNFFIHGWPYYPDGTPVASAFSGGCIRLADEDAKAIYDLAEKNMPVLVFEKDFAPDSFSYNAKKPDLSATNYLVADLKNNYVFLEEGVDAEVPIASVTKLMTSLVAAEFINIDNEITITESMIASTSKPRLFPGQKVSIYNLLFPLLMESSNEAAEAIARSAGRDRFLGLMNQKTTALGMSHTSLTDPAGFQPTNISTARDLFQLSKYLYNNRSFILKLTAGQVTNSAYGNSQFTNLQNFNAIPGINAKLIGGKVGKTTAARETAVLVYDMELQGEKRPIVIILLGSEDRSADAIKAVNYVKAIYE